MNIVCLQENLIKGLHIVSHLAGKNTTLPILNNILIHAKDGEIVLTTTNLEIGVNCKIRGKVEKEGKCTVQARLLTEFVNLLPKENVLLDYENNRLNVKCVKDKTSINTLSADDFPLIPSIDSKNKYIVKIKEFRNALSKVVFAVAMDTTRPEISGALFSIENKKMTIVGTDSYRLAEKTINLEESSSDKKIIVPIETIQEVLRIMSDTEEENIDFYLEENQILFKLDNIELVSRLTEGSYPDYKQIIPSGAKTKTEIDIREFIQAVKRISLFCKPGINDIKLNFVPNKNEIIISSISDQLGEGMTSISSKIEGEENEITFNYRYLLDGLNNILGDKLVLEINDSGSPGLMKSDKDSEYIYIIMPIKQ